MKHKLIDILDALHIIIKYRLLYIALYRLLFTARIVSDYTKIFARILPLIYC